MTTIGNLPAVVSREEWLAARLELLAKEKELTRARDRVNADRRRLPMVRIDKPYTFEGPDGPVGLLDLFEGRLQLVMHHFMLSPDWDTACPSCSSAADQIGRLRQLHVRNTTLVAVSRAPYPTLAAYRERMGWAFPWYSSYGSDFNYDFHATLDDRVAPVLLHFRTEAELAEAGTPWTKGPWTPDMNGEEMPGISAFLRVGDEVFHTYSTFGRGIEDFHNGYPWLDLTALGRQEAWEEPAGRAEPLGLQVGGPAMRLPDEYHQGRLSMTYDSANPGEASAPGLPAAVDRAAFQAELDRLRTREKAHTREGDAIAAARRRLPMTEVDASTELIGPDGPLTLLDAFERRRQLVAYYFMWNPGRPASEQCEGCTFYTSQVTELSSLHSRDITYAVFLQGRNVASGGTDPQASYHQSLRYRDFMGWDTPWYSAQSSLGKLLGNRELGLFHLVCYLRDGEKVFETYWTRRRGVEAMDNSYALMDLTVYGRQESWEDSPLGWPQHRSNVRTDGGSPDWPPVSVWPGGRPIAQWPRLAAGCSDDLGVGSAVKESDS